MAPRTRLAQWAPAIALTGLLLLSAGSPTLGLEPAPETEQTTVIDLLYRPAEEVMPALEPHSVGRPVSISASGNRLILHGPTRDLGVLIDIIAAIDVPPRMLWITLAQDPGGLLADLTQDSDEMRAESGPGPQDLPAWDSALSGHAVTRRWGTRGEEANRVLVREGDWASVEARAISVGSGLGAQVQASPRVEVYLPEWTPPGPLRAGGFRIRPRLTGDRVTLDVDFYGLIETTWSGESRTQARRTVVTGRLGDWIPLGGEVAADVDDPTAGMIARTRSGGTSRLVVRVTPAAGP
ncbi:MAG: hypothetical protein WAK53_05885 [Chromatiaceae bacterium]